MCKGPVTLIKIPSKIVYPKSSWKLQGIFNPLTLSKTLMFCGIVLVVCESFII